MKKPSVFTFFTTISLVSLSLIACGGESATEVSTQTTNQPTIYDGIENLPNCTDKRNGESATLIDESVYKCVDGKWELFFVPTKTVETLEDLPNCSKKMEGDTTKVNAESAIFKCEDSKWIKYRAITDTTESTDNLPACSSTRENNTAFITGENAIYTCSDAKWVKTRTFMISVESEDDIKNCTKSSDGDSAYAKKENMVYLCINEKWRVLGAMYDLEDDLENCTKKREYSQAFVRETGATLICSDEKWIELDIYEFIVEDISTKNSSSSMNSSSSAKSSSSRNSSSSAKSSSSRNSSSSAKSSSSAVSPATKTCKLFFCGDETADQSEVDLGNGIKAYWASFHDDFSYFTWPKGVNGNNFYSPENVATYKAIKGTAHYYKTKDFVGGFIAVNLSIPNHINATTWGGLCLEYSSTREFAINANGTDESKDAQPYFMVPAKATKDVIDIPWTKFNKGSWGSNPPDITTAVTSLKGIVIDFNHFDETTETTFNIYKLGKYGTCN